VDGAAAEAGQVLVPHAVLGGTLPAPTPGDVQGKYGESPQGFLAYVKEQVGALQACEARGIGARECALYF